MTKYSFIALAIATTLFTSCKKETVAPSNGFQGLISVSNIEANDTISESTFILKGSIVGEVTMHGYHVVLYNQADNSVLKEYKNHIHSNVIALNDTIDSGVSSVTQVRLFIESAYDHDGNGITKTVKFYIKP